MSKYANTQPEPAVATEPRQEVPQEMHGDVSKKLEAALPSSSLVLRCPLSPGPIQLPPPNPSVFNIQTSENLAEIGRAQPA